MRGIKRIVIVGAGFGGVYAYLGLHRRLHGTHGFQITIVNETDVFTFIPLIHEVATGNLLPGSVIQPIRTLPTCCLHAFVEGRAEHIDFDKRIVRITRISGGGKEEISYDALILATGSEACFYDIPGAREHTFPLKDLRDAQRLKNRIIESFAHARESLSEEALRRSVRFVIVGGGATGVEIAGELADLFGGELMRAFPAVAREAQIVLVTRGEGLLADADPWFGAHARRILEAKPFVTMLFGTSVTEAHEHGIKTTKGHIDADTVIWAAGVTPREIDIAAARKPLRDEKTGRIKVTKHLSIPEYPEVCVVGDYAWIPNEEGGSYPMRAQFAKEEGDVAAENLVRRFCGEPLRSFCYRERGFIVSLGKGGALAKIFGVRFSGPLAWFMYRHAYFTALVGWRAKVRTGVEWFLNLFLPRDISKV